MNKKGFTLVELLAVIVILSIIAVITIPMIKGVIEKSKLGAIKDSVVGIEESIRLYFTSNEVKDNITFTINEGQISSEDTSKMLTYKGKIDNGSIKIYNDGLYAICIEQDGLYALKNIKDKKVTAGEGTCEFNEETNEYEGKQTGSSFAIYVDNVKKDSIPSGSYNVNFDCKGVSASWNNIYKTIMFKDITKSNYFCKIDFTTCTDDVCDTSDASWINWVGLLGYNYKDYTSLDDFLTKEISINSCSDINFFYNNTNGAYDYLSSQDSLIAEVNQRVDYNVCSTDFAYKGSVEEYSTPIDGIYKLEVYGAQGGYYGGKGGYSYGYKILNKGDVLYTCVGGAGSTKSGAWDGEISGGYNGGGTACNNNIMSGSGGGATHIATMAGKLSEIGISNKDKILIVAGGGGGGSGTGPIGSGGSGGGQIGGYGDGSDGVTRGYPGTQNAAGSAVFQYGLTSNGNFGQGGNYPYASNGGNGAGGGGGLYGGSGGFHIGGAGGGSGYIDGVSIFKEHNVEYEPKTSNGFQSGNGKAKITFVGIK